MISPKSHIKRVLQRAGLYHKLRTSSIHDLYWRIAGRNWILAREKQIDFYRCLLPELRQRDLNLRHRRKRGLQDGLVSEIGSTSSCDRTDETNQSILQERFVRFRLVRRLLVIVGKAVSDKSTLETYVD